MSRVQPASQPAVLCVKNLNIGHYTQTVQPNFFIPALLIDTIDFYHCIPFSLTLTLSRGQVSLMAYAKPICFIFSDIFHLIRMKFDFVMKQFKVNILRLPFSKIW